jgi:hypothetical protein
MITGSKTYIDPYANPAMLREDYFRSGALMGGQGESVWGPLCEMLVNGTIPVSYRFGPPLGETWVVESVQFRYIYPTGGAPDEFGTIGNPLVRPFYLMLWCGAAIAANAILGVINNGDFIKMGEPCVAAQAAGGDMIIATWQPGCEIILRSNEYEFLWVSINSNLTVAGAGTTLSAKARAYKVVG